MRTKTSNNPIFIFQDNKEGEVYNLYLFKDFSGKKENDQEEIFNALDDVRKIIHSPDVIFILCADEKVLDKQKIKDRFLNRQKIQYINYEEIKSDVFQKGIMEIVKKNNVVQRAPHGTLFKKPSGAESKYFIKASLSLLEYSQICFLALAIHKKITHEKLLRIKKIYVDTSSIISLIQATIHYCNLFKKNEYNPQIINFKSYEGNKSDFNFNAEGSFTIISASSEGKLRENKNIKKNKCFTLFYPKDNENKEECLFEVDHIKKNNCSRSSPRLILVTSEDFSLEYSKAKEVTITEQEVKRLDTKGLIKKILDYDFIDIDFNSNFDEINNNHIKFNSKYIYEKLNGNEFIKDTFTRSLLLEASNYIIYDYIIYDRGTLPNFKNQDIAKITKNKFLSHPPRTNTIEKKNVIVFLIQATNNDLIRISQKLRNYGPLNITYIIGILMTDNCHQSKTLENNICFNDTSYKYGFHCYLNLPIHDIENPDLEGFELSKGFVFCDGNDSRKLGKKQVYLAICVILELLRSNNKLNDNTSYHDVLSPKNFSRFNDSLLQVSFLKAAKGRELNFQSNTELSKEMKDVIIELMKENEGVGKIFIKSIKENHIKLTEEDKSKIEDAHPDLFNGEEEV